MQIVEKRGRVEVRGDDFRYGTWDAEVAHSSMRERIQRTLDYAICNEPEQRMLMAVAGCMDTNGIASGWDEERQVAGGVGIPDLALLAGLDREKAKWALDRLCEREVLIRLTANHPPCGPVWVWPKYEDDVVGGLR